MSAVVNWRLLRRLDEIDPAAWNGLGVSGFPFMRHEFLTALEQRRCLGRSVGWFPCHLIGEDEERQLIAGAPMYLKANSFGEFVFDWSWARAHEQRGLDYYPKLVIASPFTPATGPRVLVTPDADRRAVAGSLIDATLRSARELGVSSAHWLFGTDLELGDSPHLMVRKGCQFHWENAGYRDFDEFLARLTAKRRKEIRRERRLVEGAGLQIERVPGDRVDDEDWAFFHHLYRATFARHGNYPALSLEFFRELGRRIGDQVMLTIARRAGDGVAAALFLVGADTLYGRYWGARDDVPALHFELCYYQGIEYCIERNLQRFEPGAQGEHKVSRGFDPRPTWSYHWIADEALREGIARFLRQETVEVDRYMASLQAHSPYRADVSC